MRENEPRRTTSIHAGLICPLCGRSLLPVPIGETVTFHCKNGHQLPLRDLLSAQSQNFRHGVENLVLEWERQLDSLQATAADARQNGFIEVAEIFYRQTKSLAARIEHLRDCLPSGDPDSSSLLKVPEKYRSDRGL
jgi:hypothetical protein